MPIMPNKINNKLPCPVKKTLAKTNVPISSASSAPSAVLGVKTGSPFASQLAKPPPEVAAADVVLGAVDRVTFGAVTALAVVFVACAVRVFLVVVLALVAIRDPP